MEKKINVSETLLNQFYDKRGKKDKETFLRDYLRDDEVREAYSVYLAQAGEYERLLDRELYEFNEREVKGMFANNFTSSPATLRLLFSVCRQYVIWATDRQLNTSGLNVFDILNFKKDILPMINSKALEKEIITEEQLWTMVDLLRSKKNAQDLICPVLSFYKVKGNKNDEIINLKTEEVDEKNNTVIAREYTRKTIKDENGEEKEIIVKERTREVELPQRAMKLLIEAANEMVYKKPGKNTEVEYPLVDSEYILRPLDSGKCKSSEFMTSTGIAARTKKIFIAFAEELEEEKNVVIREIFKNVNVEKLSINNVYNSGKIHVLKQMESEKGTELDFNDYKKVNELFGDDPKNYDNTKTLYEIYTGKK